MLVVHFLVVSSIIPTLPDDTSAHMSSYLDSESLVGYLASSKTRRSLRDRVQKFDAGYSANKQSGDFSFLSEYPNLEQVYLSRPGVANVSFLPSLTRLRVVDLTGYIGDVNMCTVLPSAKTLEVVRLRTIAPESRVCLPNFRKLKKLYVDRLDDLSILQGLESLEQLEIRCLRTRSLEPLAMLKRLKILRIMDAQAFAFSLLGLDALHATLEELDIYAAKLRTVAPIGNLSGLRRLNLSSGVVISDLVSELSRLTQLEHLEIRPFGLASLSFLLNMGETLRTLSVRCTDVSDLRDFRNLQKLESLEIHQAYSIRDISGITLLSNLKDLTLDSMNSFSWQPLPLLRKLKTLRLRFCEIRTVEEIAKIVSLESLALEIIPNLTDVSLLSSLTNLRKLHLARTGVTDVSAFLARSSLDFTHEK